MSAGVWGYILTGSLLNVADHGRNPVPGSVSYQKHSNTLAVCCKVCLAHTHTHGSDGQHLHHSGRKQRKLRFYKWLNIV